MTTTHAVLLLVLTKLTDRLAQRNARPPDLPWPFADPIRMPGGIYTPTRERLAEKSAVQKAGR